MEHMIYCGVMELCVPTPGTTTNSKRVVGLGFRVLGFWV